MSAGLRGALAVALAMLVALAWIDARRGLLPDRLTLPLLWLGLLVNLDGALVPLRDAVLGAVAGYAFLAGIAAGFRLLTGREGMGGGDVKLLAALGAWLGWAALPQVVLAASALALAVAVLRRLAGGLQPGQAFSFGPFLALAGALGLLVV